MRREQKRRVKRGRKRKGDGKERGDRRKEEEREEIEDREERGREGRRGREKEVKSAKPQGYIMDVHEASMKQAGLRHKRHRKEGMEIYSL